ncbi:MAG: aminodeoxychorismate synthase component I [Saprospiraceae bacterium]
MNEFTKRSNTTYQRLGSQRRPFLLLTDFEMIQPVIFSLDELDSSVLKYQFPQASNDPYMGAAPTVALQWETTYVSPRRYQKAFNQVQAGMHRGDSFLLNLTFPTVVQTNWSLEEVYWQTQARYKLWWKDNIAVFSPETFVRIAEGRIYAYPMKGTLHASHPLDQLLTDAKERAEHATIVDLIRNDLSQVANQVEVVRYRYGERIETTNGGLWQTSSEIRGILPMNFHRHLGNLLSSLLPAGSISGAPKPATLQLIRAAEGQPRGFYTGIAALWDGYGLDSCVMIRFLEKKGDTYRFWSGGGITAYSNWQDEYKELKEKVYLPVRAVVRG